MRNLNRREHLRMTKPSFCYLQVRNSNLLVGSEYFTTLSPKEWIEPEAQSLGCLAPQEYPNASFPEHLLCLENSVRNSVRSMAHPVDDDPGRD